MNLFYSIGQRLLNCKVIVIIFHITEILKLSKIDLFNGNGFRMRKNGYDIPKNDIKNFQKPLNSLIKS